MTYALRASIVVLVILAGCSSDSTTTPSSEVGGIVVESEMLSGSSSGSTLCVVKGTYFNTNGFTVQVTLEWRAFDGSGTQLPGTALVFDEAAAPRTRVSYESTIFDVSVTCPRIARLERFLTRARRA
jgi:hypothetical protein